MIIKTDKRIRLWGWDGEINEVVRAILFGEMLKIGFPIVKYYHCDFYRNAQWIQQHVHGPKIFYWSLREYGTDLDEDPQSVWLRTNTIHYEVELTCDGGCWFVEFKRRKI
jgi:hypothetical protein